MFGIGLGEIMLFILIIILAVGAQRLPEMGRSLGDAIEEVRREEEA